MQSTTHQTDMQRIITSEAFLRGLEAGRNETVQIALLQSPHRAFSARNLITL